MGGWNFDRGSRERNLMVAIASALGALLGGAVAWVWDHGFRQMRYEAPAVRPKGARGS